MAKRKVKTYNEVEDEILKLTQERDQPKTYLAEKIGIRFPRLDMVLKHMIGKRDIKLVKIGREHLIVNIRRRR